MKKIIKLLSATLLPLITFNAYADTVPVSDDTATVVKQTVTAFMQKNNIPGAVVEMYVDGKPSSYYFGYANRDKKSPMTKKTIFEVGSISKLMTSIVLAQEVDYAKLGLNDPVRKYLDNLSADYDDITLKHLATHTSGLTFNVPKDIKSQPDLYKYFANWTPGDAAGDSWNYSNTGIGMLGFVLEKSMHKNIDQIYRTRLLNTLKMQPIGTTVPRSMMKNFAQGYDKNGKYIAPEKMGLFPAAGAVKATADDMQRFLSAAIGLPGTPERILYPMRLTESAFVKLPTMDQGLGWQIHSLNSEDVAELLDEPEDMNLGPIKVEEIYKKPIFNGDSLIDKTGGTAGFRTYIALIPNKKSGIVILTNKYVSNGEIVRAGREILFKVTNIKSEENTETQEGSDEGKSS